MKCPKCGTKVDKGNLFCPKCLEEIPWVPEYNTVETILTKRDFNEKKRLKKLKKTVGKQHMAKKKLIKIFFLVLFLAILCVFLGVKLYMDYKNSNSYAYQYNMAEECYLSQDYERAIEYVDRAITLNDSHPEAVNLLADILEGNGDHQGALKVLEKSVVDYPDDVELYRSLIALYLEDKKPRKVRRLLKHAGNDIRSELAEYITKDPIANYDTGGYSMELELELTAGEASNTIYYTLDGSPVKKKRAIQYKDSILIGEGTTELRAVSYNEYGIPSDEIYHKYIVAMKGPDAPVIMPEETYFETDTEITIEVPEGCICYYAFDEIPTKNSTRYTVALSVPEGEHTLYAILVASNGKESEVASRTYTLVY